jgi:hypothetical protein
MLTLVAAGALALSTSGCLGKPEPTPTPTVAFATDEEAFAAAEETYRAYVDALNARKLDENSLPDPIDFTFGEALEDELRANEIIKEADLAVVGNSQVVDVTPGRHVPAESTTIDVCIDSSETRVLDSDGEDVTPEDRDERVLLEVEMQMVGGALAIVRSEATSTC